MTARFPSSRPAESSRAAPALRFDGLGEDAAVSVCAQACLRLRSRYAECDACARACPARALRVGEQSMGLEGDCSACGRCAAACPMGALAVRGFSALHHEFSTRHRSVTVDCARVPAGAAQIRVPCLGGLSTGQLLALSAQTERPLRLADRGWCAGCASGGEQHPAAVAAAKAAALMRDAGLPETALPRIERLPLDSALASAPVDPALARPASRRAFFGAVTGRAVAVAAEAGGVVREADAVPSASPLPSLERRRVLGSLRTLAARHGGRVPDALFHGLAVSDDCRGHRVCAAACPTGALVRYRDPGAGAGGIAHDSESCIGCGHCEAVCPEHAITLKRGRGRPGAGPLILTRFAQRECAGCGALFPARDEQNQCERCRKSAALARSAFQTLFGARP